MADGEARKPDELRPLELKTDYMMHGEGSCLAVMGNTSVLCVATVEEKVPPFLADRGQGWVTAEYGMLPRSTGTRQMRERARSGAGGRALEIGRLIGRSLRMAVDLEALGERTVILDCDVIQADGGTRCCAVNGAAVALHLALAGLQGRGLLENIPMRCMVGAVSVGLVEGRPVLDLDYRLDSSAEVDMNVVMTSQGEFVEIQATAEGKPFTKSQSDELLELAGKGIAGIMDIQRGVLGL